MGGKSFTLQPSMVSIKRYQKTIHGELDIARYGAQDDYRVSKWRLTHIPLLVHLPFHSSHFTLPLYPSHFTPPTSYSMLDLLLCAPAAQHDVL